MTSIINALKPIYIFNSICFWTGSNIDFYWVKNGSRVHKSYVQRRLNKISEKIKKFSCLKFIPSKIRTEEIDLNVEGPWNTEKYCRSPWLADKKFFEF